MRPPLGRGGNANAGAAIAAAERDGTADLAEIEGRRDDRDADILLASARLGHAFDGQRVADPVAVAGRGHEFAVAVAAPAEIAADEARLEREIVQAAPQQLAGRIIGLLRHHLAAEQVANDDADRAAAGLHGNVGELERAGRDLTARLENVVHIDVDDRRHRGGAGRGRQRHGEETGPNRVIAEVMDAGETDRRRAGPGDRDGIADADAGGVGRAVDGPAGVEPDQPLPARAGAGDEAGDPDAARREDAHLERSARVVASARALEQDVVAHEGARARTRHRHVAGITEARALGLEGVRRQLDRDRLVGFRQAHPDRRQRRQPVVELAVETDRRLGRHSEPPLMEGRGGGVERAVGPLQEHDRLGAALAVQRDLVESGTQSVAAPTSGEGGRRSEHGQAEAQPSRGALEPRHGLASSLSAGTGIGPGRRVAARCASAAWRRAARCRN